MTNVSEPNNDAMLLDSRTYKQKDLHDLRRADVSDSVKIVIEMLLARDPKKVSRLGKRINVLF